MATSSSYTAIRSQTGRSKAIDSGHHSFLPAAKWYTWLVPFLNACTKPFRWLQKKRNTQSIDTSRTYIYGRFSFKTLIALITHFLAFITCLVLVVLNLNPKGMFIGYKFAATHIEETQALSMLALQVCAKIIETIVVTSLSLIIGDLLNYFVLFNENGLPMTLSSSKIQFNNILFLFSPSFWSGVMSFRGERSKAFASFLILSCGLVAAFVGSSSALLLVPRVRTSWPAGGATYPIYSPVYPLYPSLFDASTVNLTACSGPDIDGNSLSPESEHCPWFSTVNLTVAIKLIPIQESFLDPLRNLTMYDGFNRRAILWSFLENSGGVFAVTALSYVNQMSFDLYLLWLEAVGWASRLYPCTHFARWYFLRTSGGTSVEVPGMVPAVQSKCYVQERVNFSDTSHDILFPAIPLYDFAADGLYYQIAPTLIHPTDVVSSYWITPPANNTRDGPLPWAYWSDAALMIQIPSVNSTLEGNIVACSIDARWVSGKNMFRDFYHDAAASPILYPEVNSNDYSGMNYWMPVNDSSWHTIAMDLSWLNTLTLHSNSSSSLSSNMTPEFTSSARDSVSRFIMMDPSSSMRNLSREDVWNAYSANSLAIGYLEFFLSALTVDAIARSNLNSIVSNFSWTSSSWWADLSAWPEHLYGHLLWGDFEWPTLTDDDVYPYSDQLSWNIFISGYAMKADSAGYYLALVPVIASMLSASVHFFYMILRRNWSSTTWGDPDNMLTLALESPAVALERESVRFPESYKAKQRLLKLRAHFIGKEMSSGIEETAQQVDLNADTVSQKDSAPNSSFAYEMTEISGAEDHTMIVQEKVHVVVADREPKRHGHAPGDEYSQIQTNKKYV